jgi:mannose-6-phosphate isomerase-like protein (cupin superfamily)
MQIKSSRWVTGLCLCAAFVLAAAPIGRSGFASKLFAKPATNATAAAYVTTAEIDAALQKMPPTSTTYDKPIKTVDTGAYKVTIVVLRRIPSKTPDSALLHDRVTEVYQIISGAGMFETGGTLMDGKPVDLTSEAAGPSIRGTIEGGESRRMGPGDVVVIPPGLPHRFSSLEGTITYLVTRIEAPRP